MKIDKNDTDQELISKLEKEVKAYKWAYEYLQSRMESIDRHGWAHDCDSEIEFRIHGNTK